jgi:H/ACA ribonucleoprotein complex subunit 2
MVGGGTSTQRHATRSTDLNHGLHVTESSATNHSNFGGIMGSSSKKQKSLDGGAAGGEEPPSKKSKKSESATAAAAAPTQNDDRKPVPLSSEAAPAAAPVLQKTYEERLEAINIISQPMASKKSTKKIHKLVKKVAAANKKQHLLRRGVKEVIKAVRKGESGLAILAGDIYPLDVISHLPVYLEEKNIPYLFVPSKQDLGAAAHTKRPTSIVLVKKPVVDAAAASKRKSTGDDAAAKDTTATDDMGDALELYDALVKEAREYDPSKR